MTSVDKINVNLYTSALLKSLINMFNNHGIKYIFTRNYENYPEDITGDIDIFIDPSDEKKSDKCIIQLIAEYNWRLFYYKKNNNMMTYQIYKNNISNDFRKILVIEIFKGFTLNGFEYVSFNDVYRYKLFYNNMNVLEPSLGFFFTLLHYHARVGYYPLKYISGTKHQFFINKQFLKYFSMQFLYKNEVKNIFNTVCNMNVEKCLSIENVPEKIYCFNNNDRFLLIYYLLKASFILSFGNFFRNIILLISDTIKKICNPMGLVVFINDTSGDISPYGFLKELKKYHVFKNSSTNIYRPDNFCLFRIIFNIHNGGIVIIPTINDNSLNNLDKIKLKIIKLYTYCSSEAFLPSVSKINNNKNISVNSFINYLLSKKVNEKK